MRPARPHSVWRFVLFVLAVVLCAALPVAEAVPSIPQAPAIAARQSGVAPLAVHLDATATTGSTTNRPFQQLCYHWDFGDAGSGNWSVSDKVHDAIDNDDGGGTGEFSVELWTKSASTSQGAPARIVSYSPDAYDRNFEFMQCNKRLNIRLRIGNEVKLLVSEDNMVSTSLQHFVVTYNKTDDKMCVYRNGTKMSDELSAGGDLKWYEYEQDSGMRLQLFNCGSYSDRDWYRELYPTAVYDKALSGTEGRQNYDAGLP